MDALLQEFLNETSESLQVVDIELVRLEQEPNNAKILDNIFRLVHTIKGACGFLGLPRLEALAHSAETLMGNIRNGKSVTEDSVSCILQALDRVKEILFILEQSNGVEPEGSDSDLINALNRISFSKTSPLPQMFDHDLVNPMARRGDQTPQLEAPFVLQALERELRPNDLSLNELEPVFQERGIKDTPFPAGKQSTRSMSDVKTKPIEDRTETRGKPGCQQSLRVNVDTLESLMMMVSELVLTRNQLLEIVRRHEDSEFKVPLQRLSNVTAELQEGVMKTRMQPIGHAWQKLPRMIRDLANELHKDIDLRMIGAETELDRHVLEMIKDPLTHMVRNSADHGLETPDERRQAGKSKKGVIELSAYHEGGYIMIDISDDGRGLNVQKITEKIIADGLASEADIAHMSETQIQRYIFHAGLSTATNVTSVSGRGVGMDVVRNNIEEIGGTIDVKSIRGKGSTFTIKIPLTLAIISALIVEAAGDQFAIPQLSVVELVQAGKNGEHQIEWLKETPVLRLRSKLLPLVRLGRLLNIQTQIDHHSVFDPSEDTGLIVVMRVGSQTFGVVVDGVFHTEEIVVKPMTTVLRNISVFSGNTILSDGSVIMIIDPNGIVNDVSLHVEEEINDRTNAENVVLSSDNRKTSMLLLQAGSTVPKALPLSLVTRLEEINVEQIETSHGRLLVQYRGSLMPLVYLNEDVERRITGKQPMLVFSDRSRSMGLIVDEFVDIVDEVLDIEVSSHRAGIVGSAIIKGKVTEIIDFSYYLPMAFDNGFNFEEGTDQKHVKRLLLVEESDFFRDMLTPILQAADNKVMSVSNVQQAQEVLNQTNIFDVVMIDVEGCSSKGFDLANIILNNPNYGGLALVALSSVFTPVLTERCQQAGFDVCVGKFDRPALLAALREL